MSYDVAIVGAGMAGASLACELAGSGRILLLEAEPQPGYHATGRSAAFWTETYGGPAVQPLTSASGRWLATPPPGVSDTGFLTPRGALHLAGAGDEGHLDRMSEQFAGKVRLDPLDRPMLESLIPGLIPGFNHGLAEPSCTDIDVAGFHAACLGAARRGGVELLCDAEVLALDREPAGWRVATLQGVFRAGRIVNAAGAWASALAALAGAAPIAITPYRRTIVQLVVSPAVPAHLPLVIDATERFYFKPEAGGRLWLSPHDETASAASDVAPEELDVAIAIHRLEQVVDWHVVARERAWAGLRSFAPDRAPIYGFDARVPDFFWFAGQGGFGIQTAPAAAMIGAALLTGDPLPDPVRDIDVERYAPTRIA